MNTRSPRRGNILPSIHARITTIITIVGLIVSPMTRTKFADRMDGMIVQSSRPTRASRMRQSRSTPWPVIAIVLVIVVGFGAAALIALAH